MLHKFNLKSSQIIILLIAISILIRILYAGIQPQMIVTADSLIYYDLASKMFSEPSVKLVINPFKTPLYGLTIYTVMILFGDKPAPVGSEEFIRLSSHLMLVQQIVGIVGVSILFKLALTTTKSKKASFVIALSHALNPLNFAWERAMLTESLGTLFVIVFTFMLLLILQKPKHAYFGFLFLISVLGFLLRPAFMFIPVTGLILVSVISKKLKVIIGLALVFICYLAAIWVFTRLNIQNWQYRGIQITGDINLLGKVLQYNLPIAQAENHSYFYNLIKDYRAHKLPLHPYRFLDYYDPNIYLDFPKLENLRQFSSRVILDNFLSYLGKTIMLVPQALFQADQTLVIKGGAVFKPIALLVSFGQHLYGLLQLGGLMIFVVLPLYIYKIFTNRLNLSESQVTVIAFFVVQQVLLSVFLSYEEYGRLITVISPLIILTVIYWLGKFTVRLGK